MLRFKIVVVASIDGRKRPTDSKHCYSTMFDQNHEYFNVFYGTLQKKLWHGETFIVTLELSALSN